VSLPVVIQKPDCLYTFNRFKIGELVTSMSSNQAETAFIYDQASKSVTIETDDVFFAGQLVEVKVTIDQSLVLGAKDYVIKVQFEADPPSLNLDDINVPPVTCGPKDADWVIQLPEVEQQGSEPVQMQLKREGEHAGLFDLNAELGLLTLETKAQEALIAG